MAYGQKSQAKKSPAKKSKKLPPKAAAKSMAMAKALIGGR